MIYRVIFEPSAEEHLDELFRYIESKAGTTVADSYVEAVIAFCEGLDMFPLRGVTRDDIRPGLRILGFRKRAVIAFAVRDEMVHIIGVFHGGRDYEQILAPSSD